MIEKKEFSEGEDKKLPFFVDEVIVLKEAINDIVSDPETKRRIYNRASELMAENKKVSENK